MIDWIKKRSLFSTWLSIALICLIGLNIILYGIFFQLRTNASYEYRSSCAEKLRLSAAQMDENLSIINSIANNLSFNTDIIRFRSIEQLNNYNRLSISQLSEDLSRYVLTNPILEDIFLYYKKGDYFITSNGYYNEESQDFFSSFYMNLNNYQVNDLMSRKYAQEYLIISDNLGEKQLYFFDTIPYEKTLNNGINLIMKINMEELYKSLTYHPDTDMVLAFRDNTGNVLSEDYTIPVNVKASVLKNRYDVPMYQMGDGDALLYTSKSSVMKGEYCSVFNLKTEYAYLDSLSRVFGITAVLLNFLLLGGFALLFFVSSYGFRPVRQLLGGTRRMSPLDLEKRIQQVLSERQLLEKNSDSGKKSLGQISLMCYLNMPGSASLARKLFLDHFEGPLTGCRYQLCIVKPEVMLEPENLLGFYDGLEQFLREQFPEKLGVEAHILQKELFLLLWYPAEDSRRELKTICSSCLRRFSSKTNVALNAEFSGVFDSLHQLKDVYLAMRGLSEVLDVEYFMNGEDKEALKEQFSVWEKAAYSVDLERLSELAPSLCDSYLAVWAPDLQKQKMSLANVLLYTAEILAKSTPTGVTPPPPPGGSGGDFWRWIRGGTKGYLF